MSDHVLEALKQTLSDATAAGLNDPGDRAALLPVLLTAHLGEPAALSAKPRDGASDTTTQSASDGVDRVASWLGVASAELDGVFVDAGEGPVVSIPARRLAPNKAEATRQLAQLVLACRQGSGLEDMTGLNDIRSVVSDYGKYDSSNFTGHLSQLDTVASVVGRGSSRRFKVTRTGREAIADLIRELIKSDS